MATMPNGMTTGSGDVQECYGPMSIDAVLDAEVEAERLRDQEIGATDQ